ncbi:MAG: cupin domain-containing protein [Anaerolineae bacterium]|jgi:transcriptional regulator with XRE-family HTH domain
MSEDTGGDVGTRVRAFRQERGLSLRALSEIADLSPNTISLIERGETSPSVSTLQHLAVALGVQITSFFTEPVERKMVIFTKADKRIVSGSASVELGSLGYGLEDQTCDSFHVILKPGATSGRQMMVHSGTELVYCLEGEVDYEIHGQHYRLEPGDSLLFRASQPHRWRNPTDEPCLFLMIMTASEQREESLNQHLHP